MVETKYERLLINYTEARLDWELWCYLNEIETTSKGIKDICNDDDAMNRFRFLTFKNLHIELAKILGDRKNTYRDNVFKLLREKNGKEAIQCLERLQKFTPFIKTIMLTRDKFYVHLDDNWGEIVKAGMPIATYNNLFVEIEKSIIALGFAKELRKALEKLPSRKEYDLYKTFHKEI